MVSAGYPILRRGSVGRAVLLLQQVLGTNGYPVTESGFGPLTDAAVRAFQAARQLSADGIVGPITWAALYQSSEAWTTIYLPTDPSLLRELAAAAPYYRMAVDIATKAGLAACVVAGIASRESAWGLALKPQGPGGTGDFAPRNFPTAHREGALPPDGGFGRGLMQIDFDAFEFARSGAWQDPTQNIEAGVNVARASSDYIAQHTALTGMNLLRAALAGYNCGPGNVMRAIRELKDVDYYTTGRNYGADVLSRAGWFAQQGWPGEVPA